MPLFLSKLEWNDADSVWMVGVADYGNSGHHGLALQSYGRQSLGSHRLSCRVERVGSLDWGVVALGRGNCSWMVAGFLLRVRKDG